MNVDAVKNWRTSRVGGKGYLAIRKNNWNWTKMLECSGYPETPKRNILREVTNQQQGASPTANLKLLTSVALKEDKPCHRKEKSLQKLCDRFLKLYPLHGTYVGTEIHLDATAQRLGVERRRIYDIINILEALQCATHCRKNTYAWHGASRLGALLQELRRQGEAWGVKGGAGEGNTMPSPKQRSLGVLAQRFLMMFLVEPANTYINLEMAIAVLINTQRNIDSDTPLYHDRQHKSKVRRLYDISNVLTSIGLIEKVPGSTVLKKPVFRYKGLHSVITKISTPQKCSYQLTPMSLVVKQPIKQHSSVSRSKRKLEFTSPISLPHKSSIVLTPVTPDKWNEILQVADMEYSRLKGTYE